MAELADVIKGKKAFPVFSHEREPCPSQGTATCGSLSSGRTNSAVGGWKGQKRCSPVSGKGDAHSEAKCWLPIGAKNMGF